MSVHAQQCMPWIIASRCDTTPARLANSRSAVTGHMDDSGRSPIQLLMVPMLAAIRDQGERVFLTSQGRWPGNLICSSGQATECGRSCNMKNPTQSHPASNHPQIPTSQ